MNYSKLIAEIKLFVNNMPRPSLGMIGAGAPPGLGG